MPVCKSILVKGFVQGVSYRKHTKRVALHLGVNGWVRNRSDGCVEAYLEGDERSVDALIGWCAFGPKKAHVDEVEITPFKSIGGYSGFGILEDRRVDIQ